MGSILILGNKYVLVFHSSYFWDFLALRETANKLLGFSYCGAQIFEAYGLGKDVIDIAFCGSVSTIGGLTLDEVVNSIIEHLFTVPYFILCCKEKYFGVQ